MAFEREQYPVRDSHGAEHAPAIQQTNLAGSQGLLVRVENVVVVKEKAVHIQILADGREDLRELLHLEEQFESVVHVQLLVAVEQSQAVHRRCEVSLNLLEAFHQHNVLHHA